MVWFSFCFSVSCIILYCFKGIYTAINELIDDLIESALNFFF